MTSRFFTALIALTAVFVLNVGEARAAGQVTVKYRVFPNGRNILPPEVIKGSVKSAADSALYGKTAGVAFEFLFWDIDGRLDTNPNINYAPPGGSKNFATAWYLRTGPGGGACAPHCAVGTWAFNLKNDRVMKGVTPIGSVTPGGLWTSPSTSVSTMTSGNVAITAQATIAPPGVAFRRWLELPNTKVSGATLSVPAASDALAIAFYGPAPVVPPKLGPCKPTPTGCI
jgi:hypothetical protein